MRIDSHQHFWNYDPVTHAWINSQMEVIKKDFLPSDLAPILKDSQMDGCVAVQADQSEKETDFLLQCAKENPFILGVVGWLDLCSEDIEQILESYSKYPKLKGLRHIVQDEADDHFMLRPSFLRGISKLEAHGFTYDILIYPKQLTAAVELVKMFPKQRFVLDHIAKPVIDGNIDGEWQRRIQELGSSKNVYCKVSGMVTETSWNAFDNRDFHPYLDVVFKSFATDKIMFGSDWPVCLLSAPYSRVLSILNEYLKQFSEEVQNRIMGLNAQEFYNL
ncbi:amidohydrolase family protein [Flagellimonas sp.]|uniref:amidohydrolase family protein n=1 Tax=Flagellimonas sp. TaxID=2058762 RepID=UPI003B5A5C87